LSNLTIWIEVSILLEVSLNFIEFQLMIFIKKLSFCQLQFSGLAFSKFKHFPYQLLKNTLFFYKILLFELSLILVLVYIYKY